MGDKHSFPKALAGVEAVRDIACDAHEDCNYVMRIETTIYLGEIKSRLPIRPWAAFSDWYVRTFQREAGR